MSEYRLPGVDLPGERRSVTGTYRYGDELVSMVAQTIPELHAKANRRGNGPDECLSVSTPRTIYRDLTGETAERHRSKGMWLTSEQEQMPSERA